MTAPDLSDDFSDGRTDRADPLDTLLRAQAPAALADDDFVARTMLAVARADATPMRVPRPAPLAIARALVREQQRYAAQARLWRWAMAGVAVGALLLVVAMLAAPGGTLFDMTAPMASVALAPWMPLWTLMAAGAIWFAWHEFRAD
jgi:hypothetical protein